MKAWVLFWCKLQVMAELSSLYGTWGGFPWSSTNPCWKWVLVCFASFVPVRQTLLNFNIILVCVSYFAVSNTLMNSVFFLLLQQNWQEYLMQLIHVLVPSSQVLSESIARPSCFITRMLHYCPWMRFVESIWHCLTGNINITVRERQRGYSEHCLWDLLCIVA